ncbi:hypothetical protein A3J34_05110 [Candidatus Peribacteria bacterium RIFCSPLOWO2_02_FULL_51_10]|nr:MAG: hypothetical protein A3J34_05110 [Candidatus Peribacteria bacterium RIFCSPLOWO2_02_FULL_51_10]
MDSGLPRQAGTSQATITAVPSDMTVIAVRMTRSPPSTRSFSRETATSRTETAYKPKSARIAKSCR